MIFELTQTNRARALTAGESSFLTEGGAYVGKFKQAYLTTTQSGAEFMNFEFVIKQGQSANLQICVQKKDGTACFGYDIVISMIALMGGQIGTQLKGIPATVQTRTKQVEALTFPRLCKAPIGLLLEKELFTTNQGKDTYRLNIKQAFDPKTMQTLKEKDEGKPAEIIARREKALEVVDKRNHSQAPSFDNYSQPPASASKDEGFGMSEDVPF